MAKSLSLVVGVLVALGAFNADAATNWGTRSGAVAKLDGLPATREQQNINYEKYQTRTVTRTYQSTDGGDLYYTKPANRSALYKQYDAGNSASARETKVTARKSRSETIIAKMKRKYYLAHPFFQPLEGKFGSVTDMSYLTNSYDFKINQTIPVGGSDWLTGLDAKWDMSRLSVKEDFSYGITERVAVLGMLQYDMNEYQFKWGDGHPTDKMDENGLNLFGAGVQWRVVDTDEWIAMGSVYYQHQKNISDNFLLELKAGYKVAQSTIYGLGRVWYLALDGNSYGNYVEGVDHDGVWASAYIPYQIGDDNVSYIEGGLGVFSVLNEDWTLNVEAVFGDYDWHNSATIKGAIGWQPNDWFALNLYAKTVFYDNADDQKMHLFWKEPNVGLDSYTAIGTIKMDDYAETSIGVQAIFQF